MKHFDTEKPRKAMNKYVRSILDNAVEKICDRGSRDRGSVQDDD